MITINNKNYSGNNITILNGKVIIDGKEVTPDSKEITIQVNGSIENLDVDFANSIEISGNVGKLRSGSGDVSCSNVTGGIKTGSGDVECEDIDGDVETGSGDVKAKTITGSVKTGSGNVKYL